MTIPTAQTEIGQFHIDRSRLPHETRGNGKDKGHDPVTSPSWYTQGEIECNDAIRSAISGDKDPYAAHLKACIIEKMWRCGHKDDGLQDIAKASWFLERLRQHLASDG